MMKYLKVLFSAFILILIFKSPTLAQESDTGVQFEAILTHDYIYNMSGGIKEDSANLGNIDVTLELDTENTGLWKGGTFFFYYLGNYGNNATEIVGDSQTSSNIEAYSTSKLYEAWYNHSFADEKLAALVGLYDYNSEFDALEFAGALINSSFGISPDISQVGPSIFPTTSLAFRLRYNMDEDYYIQGAVFDGVPGSKFDPEGTQISYSAEDGLFYAGEIGQATDSEEVTSYSKLAAGFWFHTAEFEDYQGIQRDENYGSYLIGERTLYTEPDGAGSIGAFFQAGWAKSDRNQFDKYIGGGLSYTGLLSDYENDVAAFGLAHARNSDDYRTLDEGIERSETAIELTYSHFINDNFTVQPDFQYIVNPGTDSALDDAFVFTLRSTISY